jgi:hypothetical protein
VYLIPADVLIWPIFYKQYQVLPQQLQLKGLALELSNQLLWLQILASYFQEYQRKSNANRGLERGITQAGEDKPLILH